jgi:hypothetical protein
VIGVDMTHESSRELVESWAPGRGIEDYAASATIEAHKPALRQGTS